MESICLTTSGFHCFNERTREVAAADTLTRRNVVVASSVPVLVPDVPEFAQPAEKFLFLQNETAEEGVVVEEKFQGYRVIYSVPKNAVAKLTALNIEPEFAHLLTVSYALMQSRLENADTQRTLVVWPEEKHFLLAFFDKGVVQMVNRFEYASYADMLYYLLNVAAQYNVASTDTLLCFFYPDKNRDEFLKNYFSVRYLL